MAGEKSKAAASKPKAGNFNDPARKTRVWGTQNLTYGATSGHPPQSTQRSE
jgi:hypothetical protein